MLTCPNCGSQQIENIEHSTNKKKCEICKTEFEVQNENKVITKEGLEVLL